MAANMQTTVITVAHPCQPFPLAFGENEKRIARASHRGSAPMGVARTRHPVLLFRLSHNRGDDPICHHRDEQQVKSRAAPRDRWDPVTTDESVTIDPRTPMMTTLMPIPD
jgi:hypothetical protein